MSQFDPNLFMQSTIEQTLDTVRILPPTDREYPGVVTKLEGKSGTIMKGERAGQDWGAIKITVELALPPEVAAKVGREKALVSDTVFLDLDPLGKLEVGAGKNVDLGRWFDATGINSLPNKSPGMLEGRSVKVKIRHASDADNPQKQWLEIAGVRKG
jgi:hypothetical protein